MKILLFVFFTLFINSNVYADINDYNSGKAIGSQLRNQGSDSYNDYMGKVKNCSKVASNIYHPGDKRFPASTCHYTLGLKDGFYGTSTNLTACTMDSLPSDISVAQILNCVTSPTTPSGFCNSQVLSMPVGNTNALFNVNKSNDGTNQLVIASNKGQSCGTGGTIDCSMQLKCQSGSWFITNKSCNCLSTGNGNFGNIDGLCTGTPPKGKTNCRCGKWVTYEFWKRTHEC